MTNPMLAELDEVVRLSEKATPGPWVANDGELATDLYWAGGGMVADALAEFADGLSDPPNAQFVAAAVNFLRTHHATLADMAKRLEAAERDSKRMDWLCSGKVYWLEIQSQPSGGHVYVGPPENDKLRRNIDAAIDATQEGEG